MKRITFSILVSLFFVMAMSSCDVFAPNFLVGKWIRSNSYGGTDSFVFSEDGNFNATVYENVYTKPRAIAGNYKAGFSVIEFTFENEKRTAAYKMYKSSIDLSWGGTTMRLHRFN